jgi:hypothetical protein
VNTHRFLNVQALSAYKAEVFLEGKSFPWQDFDAFLLPDAFQALYRDFPRRELFSRYWDAERTYGQRPMNRYHLGYRKQGEGLSEDGVIVHQDLPPAWRGFIEELETSKVYADFLKARLGKSDFERRYTWHRNVTTSEVCPHLDHKSKFATHIFYFNKGSEWDTSWGGKLLMLEAKKTDAMNPEFDDFEKWTAVDILDNRSVLFKNTKQAWHGMRPLTCSERGERRLFNVIFKRPRKK